MKLLFACLIYALMASVLGVGMVMAVKGSVWLLAVSFVVFVIAFAKIGCLHH
jgi:hypothetical protein